MSACSITASCTDRDDRLGGLRRAPAFLLLARDRAVELPLERLMSVRTHGLKAIAQRKVLEKIAFHQNDKRVGRS